MKSPKVSVIVPVYNAENFIQDTIEMLCQSTLKEIEILAINDGSTDNTINILNECAQNDKRIRVINKQNGGIVSARNCGLQEAKGEYVCFCDHDDVVEPQMYELMYTKAKSQQCEIVMCSTGKITEDGKIPFWVIEDNYFVGNEIKKECFLPLVFNRWNFYHGEKNLKLSAMIWQCMILRDFINKYDLRFRSYVSFEDDRLFVLDVLARATKFATVADVLYFWRIRPNSTSHSPKYVENVYEKDLELQNAIVKIMSIANCDQQEILQFTSLNSTYRYTRLLDNEIYHMDVNRSCKLDIVRKIYAEPDFKSKIKYAKYYPLNVIARRIACKLLQYKMVPFAYFFWEIYVKLRRLSQDKTWWVTIEKKLKFFGT